MRSADMCEAAVLNNVHALQYVPDNLHTRELYRKALRSILLPYDISNLLC